MNLKQLYYTYRPWHIQRLAYFLCVYFKHQSLMFNTTISQIQTFWGFLPLGSISEAAQHQYVGHVFETKIW
jgi:hypothetical protein